MLEYKQKRNNGRTPFAGVYKFVCVCVWVAGGGDNWYKNYSQFEGRVLVPVSPNSYTKEYEPIVSFKFNFLY